MRIEDVMDRAADELLISNVVVRNYYKERQGRAVGKKLKFGLWSDLHLEHSNWRPPEELPEWDFLLLGGDLSAIEGHLQEWLVRYCPAIPTYVVAGNHEYEDQDMGAYIERMKEFCRQEVPWVSYLERDVVEGPGGVRIAGATLWTDFEINGTLSASLAWASGLPDFTRSTRDFERRRLTPKGSLKVHRKTREWLEELIASEDSRPEVVLTHFAPVPEAVEACFAEKDNSYWVSDLSHLASKVPFWGHGHTHRAYEAVDRKSGTKVACNARGYSELSVLSGVAGFDPCRTWTVEVCR